MGCASSKQARRDRRGSPPPYARSQSMPTHHLGASSRKVGTGSGSRRHLVALTSSTLGSLKLDSSDNETDDDETMMKCTNDRDVVDKAKAWSDMIDLRMPKTIANANSTPTNTHEPETINAWELMEGLEDAAAATPAAPPLDSSFSFNSSVVSPKPMWMQIAPGDSIVSDFDPDIISNFRKALDQLSPHHQFLLRSPEPDRTRIPPLPPLPEKTATEPAHEQCVTPKFAGIVKARITAFQEKIDAKRSKKCPPNGQRKVVYYFTSLRGVRKTYEDCWGVKVILQGYGVKVDERDVSMHGGFKDELNEILGAGFGGSRLPRVFANNKYLGGADEVRQMHEDGELGRALEECEAVAAAGKGGGVCETCGDMRFVPCVVCSGSCKVFVEGEGEEEADVVVVSGFRRCSDCNENGLVRCPVCC